MRTTVQIDDDLLRDLKEQARQEGTSLARLVNRVLRLGMNAARQGRGPTPPYREKTHDMGPPKINIDKALSFAAALEDEEILEKLARRK